MSQRKSKKSKMKPKETTPEPEAGEETAPAGAGAAREAAPAEAAPAAEGPEPPSPEDTAAAEAAEKASPEEEIAALKDQLLRALAETENLRRRAAREREDMAKYAIAGFARDILTVADNLQRALAAIPAHAREEDENLNTLAVGVEATEREMLAVFERHGIRKIEPLGEKFNHDLHQAMFEVPDTGKPPGTVVELLQPGYIIEGRLLRPAMVGVAKGAPEERKIDTSA